MDAGRTARQPIDLAERLRETIAELGSTEPSDLRRENLPARLAALSAAVDVEQDSVGLARELGLLDTNR